jgi:coenzyme F420-reducing hydrogenase beta subunit
LAKGNFTKELKAINFRKKLKNLPASNYGTEIFYLENEQKKSLVVENSSFQMGTDWGHGMFKYPACDYCDDVVGELADISVGDAWLPQYIKDYKGHSVIIVRNLTLSQLLLDGVKNNEISLNEVSNGHCLKDKSGGIGIKR